MLRLISCNVGNLASSEVLAGLWDNYGPERRYTAEVVTTTNEHEQSLSSRMRMRHMSARNQAPVKPSAPKPEASLHVQRLHRVDSV